MFIMVKLYQKTFFFNVVINVCIDLEKTECKHIKRHCKCLLLKIYLWLLEIIHANNWWKNKLSVHLSIRFVNWTEAHWRLLSVYTKATKKLIIWWLKYQLATSNYSHKKQCPMIWDHLTWLHHPPYPLFETKNLFREWWFYLILLYLRRIKKKNT